MCDHPRGAGAGHGEPLDAIEFSRESMAVFELEAGDQFDSKGIDGLELDDQGAGPIVLVE